MSAELFTYQETESDFDTEYLDFSDDEEFVLFQSVDNFDETAFFASDETEDDTQVIEPAAQLEEIDTQQTDDANVVLTFPIPQAQPDLLTELRNESNEAVATFTSKVTESTFAAGAVLTSGVFSALSSIVGSCGVVCLHSLGSLAQASSSGLGSASALRGLNMPGFNVDKNGNFQLSGDIDSLSAATGFSKQDLLSGKVSTESILATFLSSFGEGMSMIFGFGLVNTLIDGIFDNFMYRSEPAQAA